MKATSFIVGLICVTGGILAGGFVVSGSPPVGMPLAKPSPDAAEAKNFLATLYDHYAVNSPWSPLHDHASDWFDPSMVALMREDEKLNEGLGAIDADPICDCQDFDKIEAEVTVVEATSARAKGAVSLKFIGAQPPDHIFLAYDLVKIKGTWRIHDITDSRGESLRHRLITSNAELKAQDSQSSR